MARTLLALTVAVAVMTVVSAQTSRSSASARELVQVLTDQQLDAVAAVDPDDSARFIASMYVPPSQLLVVWARDIQAWTR